MGKTAQEVDAYVQDLEPERRAALETLRALVFRVAPEVVETMRYRMATRCCAPLLLRSIISACTWTSRS